MFVIRIVGSADGSRIFNAPLYVKSYDPDFVPPYPEPHYPSGNVSLTLKIEEAMRFASQADAWRTWATQSKTLPLRPDGLPNKPLTAYTIIAQPAPEVEAVK